MPLSLISSNFEKSEININDLLCPGPPQQISDPVICRPDSTGLYIIYYLVVENLFK